MRTFASQEDEDEDEDEDEKVVVVEVVREGEEGEEKRCFLRFLPNPFIRRFN